MRSLPTSVGLIPAVLLAVMIVMTTGAEAQSPAAFTNDIRPIMERSCWDCHGERMRRSGLDLRTREAALRGGSLGAAIVPGRAEESLLYRMVAGLEEPIMPRDGDPLTVAEVAAVRAWIDEGAHWDDGPTAFVDNPSDVLAESELPPGAKDYWAFKLPVQGPVPVFADFEHPIDRFLEQTRRANGVTAAPRADRSTLLRRAHLDLTGLPPTQEQTAAFLADPDPGVWERLIDQLLDSPHYGERWGRHWLDVARYADSDGFEQDVDRPNAWRYRDWLIDSLNTDQPYDEFVFHQLAGDEVTPAAALGTGFLLAGQDMPDINLRAERRHMVLNEMTTTVGSVFLGLTVGCAQCHDHKSDPISQADFYRLRAFFESGLQFKEQKLAIAGGEVSGRVMRISSGKLVPTRFAVRGDFRRLGQVVKPAVPRIALGLAESSPATSRADLAKWMSGSRNPLFLRSAVNRLWQFHFGQPLAGTPNDIGRNGEKPSHPELLDYLATWLVKNDWSIKKLNRLIVLSSTWQQASIDRPTHRAADPLNRLLWRMNRRRLGFEAMRDSMLSVAGQLERRTGGRPTEQRPDDSTNRRRTMYSFVDREKLPDLFRVFDFPCPDISAPSRSQTTVPQQSLFLLNSPFVIAQAEAAAQGLGQDSGGAEQGIRQLYRQVLGREPAIDELALAKRYVVDRSQLKVSSSGKSSAPNPWAELAQALLLSNEFLFVD